MTSTVPTPTISEPRAGFSALTVLSILFVVTALLITIGLLVFDTLSEIATVKKPSFSSRNARAILLIT